HVWHKVFICHDWNAATKVVYGTNATEPMCAAEVAIGMSRQLGEQYIFLDFARAPRFVEKPLQPILEPSQIETVRDHSASFPGMPACANIVIVWLPAFRKWTIAEAVVALG